jgi:hypothetical protein
MAVFLVHGSRLEQFEAWVGETELALTQAERDFLRASIQACEQEQQAEKKRQAREVRLEQRSRNFLQGLVAVFAIAAVTAIILSLFAFDQRRIAQDNAAEAERNAAESQNLALISGSVHYSEHPQLAGRKGRLARLCQHRTLRWQTVPRPNIRDTSSTAILKVMKPCSDL